jgi:hypothetical protein
MAEVPLPSQVPLLVAGALQQVRGAPGAVVPASGGHPHARCGLQRLLPSG